MLGFKLKVEFGELMKKWRVESGNWKCAVIHNLTNSLLHAVKLYSMLSDLVARYPIDPERIYVSGHSNGSQMTQLLMRKSPELFAGFNPVGGIERSPSGEAVPEPDEVVRPVWYVLGEFDGAGMYLTGYTEAVFKELCRTDRCDFEHRKSYVSGIHHVTVAKNAAGDPLVRFSGLKNYPHSFSPELSLMVWDDFFAKLKRRPDGSVEWLA